MKTQLTALAVAAAVLSVLAGCGSGTADEPNTETSAVAAAGDNPDATGTTETAQPETTTTTTTKPSHTKTSTPTPTATSTDTAKIVSFELVQKPKCPEGTAVFRSESQPAIIKWKITGADSAALSVDDPTNTPGTYGPEGLSGTKSFTFSCTGEVGSTEKHTYAIYTVGGGKQRSKTIVATAKILDDGTN